jgi:hypothetical protein
MLNCSNRRVVRINTLMLTALLSLLVAPASLAGLSPGLLSDFESGTVEGWEGGASPTPIAEGGPAGAGDGYLQIGNDFSNFATYNMEDVAGPISASVLAVDFDLMRPSEDPGALEMRLVLVAGTFLDERWTSSVAQVVANDGLWRTYRFSLLEADLVQVQGTGSYEDLRSDLDRMLIRYDPGTPNPGGSPVDGTLGIDNVFVVPEPTTSILLGGGLALIASGRGRRR